MPHPFARRNPALPNLDRRNFVKFAAAAAATAPFLSIPSFTQTPDPAWPTQTLEPYVTVEIADGKLRGGHSRGALAFKGIPYAGSVSGKNRFKAPPKVDPWTGVRDALLLGPPALQAPGGTYGEHEPDRSEDCLFLNVWTPANDNKKRPVMVYLHGGGFTSGSGGQNIQDGSHLAANYDVVVVATNHRLGLFGYLYLGELGGEEYATSGNQGMMDVVASLEWIKQNIHVFGGDPGNVFVFGESGGGSKTCALMAMPAGKGLFHKAGVQSGPMLRGANKDAATETARRVLRALSIAPTDLSKLADVPADQLLDIQLTGQRPGGALSTPSPEWAASHPAPVPGRRGGNGGAGWGPVVDGKVLPRDPFDPDATPLSAHVPLLIGNMHDEAVFNQRNNPAFFHQDEAAVTASESRRLGANAEKILSTYRKAMPDATPVEVAVAIETATFNGTNTIALADRKSAQPAAVFRYRNDHRSNVPVAGTDWTLRACHASDIAQVFDNFEIPDLQGTGPGIAEVSHAMSGYFAGFARHGVPTVAGLPAWPRYNTKTRATMLLNTECRVEDDPDSSIRKMWQSLPS
jgi:para-nitrobenzyl esterase